MRRLSLLSLFFLLSPLAHADTGALCLALNAPNPTVESLRAALANDSVSAVCGTISATARAMKLSQTKPELAIFLINQGADPNFVNAERTGSWGHSRRFTTNLAWAASRAPIAVLQAFLARKPDVDFAPQGKTALDTAMEFQKWDSTRALLDAGANPYVVSYTVGSDGKRVVIDTALRLAINFGAPMRDELLRSWNFSQDPLDLTNRYLATALASQRRSLSVITSLIARGANPRVLHSETGSYPDRNALTAFADGLKYGNGSEDPAIADYLLGLGLDVNEHNGIAMFLAVIGNKAWLAEKLLDHGADPNTRITGDTPALVESAHQGSVDLVRTLARHGARLNDVGSDGKTALIMAIQTYHFDVALALIELGADVNQPGTDGVSPLCWARQFQATDVATALLAHGAHSGTCTFR